jgi:hypothetical protein
MKLLSLIPEKTSNASSSCCSKGLHLGIHVNLCQVPVGRCEQLTDLVGFDPPIAPKSIRPALKLVS